MKYELEPDNRNCSDEELLADLRKVATQCKRTPTKDLYNEHGRFSAATMQKRFGSWNKALSLSGLAVSHRVDIPESELLDDLRSVALKLGVQSVTTEQYELHGNFSVSTIARNFGGWADVLNEAGMQPTGYKPKATEEELFDNMAVVWEHVGRQPKQKDFHPPFSRYGNDVYVRRFGSWRAALEAFVEFMNAEQGDAEKKEMSPAAKVQTLTPKQTIVHKTERDPSWRLRFLVMRRDNFACRFCGASPAKDPSVNLHIDHVLAWVKGGETVFENLQTLCERCNIGKSDLPI